MRLARAASAVLLLAACTSTAPCPAPDRGGWLVAHNGETYGVHVYCTPRSERFVLQLVTKRTPDGSAAEWADLATLQVWLADGESTMSGFECGSGEAVGGDAIAVVRRHGDDSFTVTRAWRIDTHGRRFVSVPADAVVCEAGE